MKHLWSGLPALTLALTLAEPSQAQYTYASFAVPGATRTCAYGINVAGEIVGFYEVGNTPHGFLLSGGKYTTIDVPGATYTYATAINNAGEIVGYYIGGGKTHGFLLSDGQYTTIDVPGANSTVALGINDAGEIVGGWDGHAFLLRNGNFVKFDVPGATSTAAWAINNNRQIAGRYDANGIAHGFFLKRWRHHLRRRARCGGDRCLRDKRLRPDCGRGHRSPWWTGLSFLQGKLRFD
jgi:probable HAF family extracellular repeat protein